MTQFIVRQTRELLDQDSPESQWYVLGRGTLSALVIVQSKKQWLSGRVLDSRPKGRGFEPHRRHCVVVLEQDTFIPPKYWLNPGRPVPA